MLVSTSPIKPSWSTVLIASRTNVGLVEENICLQLCGISTKCFSSDRTPSTTWMVLVSPPCFMIGM